MSTRRPYKPSGYRSRAQTISAIRSQRSAQAAAAAMIRRTPTLKGYARSGSAYTGKYKYGGKATAEVKFIDTAQGFTFDATGEVPGGGQLNLIAQGVGESQRVGRKVVVKSIHARWTIQPNANTWLGSTVRLLLVQDTQCNGAAATYSGVGGVLESDSVTAFRNLENSNRFIIHMDKFFSMQPTAGILTAFNATPKCITFNKKCNIPIEFDSSATTGAIETIRSNNLFLLARSSLDDDLIQCIGVVRIRYTDN